MQWQLLTRRFFVLCSGDGLSGSREQFSNHRSAPAAMATCVGVVIVNCAKQAQTAVVSKRIRRRGVLRVSDHN